MSRDAVYRLALVDNHGDSLHPLDHLIWVDFTPPDDSPLTLDEEGLPTIIALPHAAFANPETDGESGWEDWVLGLQQAGRLAWEMDLSKVKGSTEIEAFRTYLVKPVSVDDAVLQFNSSSYVRQLPTYMDVVVRTNNGFGDTPNTILFHGIMRPFDERDGTAVKGGKVIVKVELIDAMRFVLETMIPKDVAAYATLNATDIDGPHDFVNGEGWSESFGGGVTQTYRRLHGDLPGTDDQRQFYGMPFSDLWLSISEVGGRLLSLFTRRGSPFVLAATARAGLQPVLTPYDHWILFEQNGNKDWLPSLADALLSDDWYIIGKIALESDPDTLVHGFYYVDENAPDDTLGSWKTMWDFVSDISAHAHTKAGPFHLIDAITGAPVIYLIWYRIDEEVFDATLATQEDADVRSVDCGKEIAFTIGAKLVARATTSIPAPTENDQSSIDATYGTVPSVENDDDFPLPRGFHNLPTGWPSGERAYRDVSTSGLDRRVDLVTPHFNCMTLLYRDAGQLIRCSNGARVSLKSGTTRETTAGAPELPTPNVEWASSGGAYDIADYPEDGDDALGTDLLIAILNLQLMMGMPYLSALCVAERYSDPMLTDYTTTLPFTLIPPQQLGNVCDPTFFPSGNFILDGGTYFGDLPGKPTIAKIQFDILKTRATAVLEGRPS